jgi:hypothetical protein
MMAHVETFSEARFIGALQDIIQGSGKVVV